MAVLSAFAASPYPAAFVLGGDTGTGKTSAAWALGGDLGCNVDATPPECGGIYSIPSGEQNAEALRTIWPTLRFCPFQSARGWKVLIVNEVESLNGAVERLWLDRLEEIWPKTAVVFTTNKLASLPDRFLDRCMGGVIEFRSSLDDLAEDARQLARDVWRSETGADVPDDVLDGVVRQSARNGRVSFRHIVQLVSKRLATEGQHGR